MKKHILPLIILIIASGCVKDAELSPRNYPTFITEEATDIDSTGVTLNAIVTDIGNDEITDYGFYITNGTTKYSISAFTNAKPQKFSARLSTDMISGHSYYCKAYMKTVKNLILSNEVLFSSLGSIDPIILNIFPDSGFDGTKVRMFTKYLSKDTSKNEIYVNNIRAQIISQKNDTIEFYIPQNKYVGEVDIKLKSYDKTINTPKKFLISGPEIESIFPTTGKSGDLITITGKNLDRNSASVQVLFGSNNATIRSSSESKIEFYIPAIKENLLKDMSYTIKLVNGLKTAIYKRPYIIIKSWELKTPTPFTWPWYYEGVSYNEKGYMFEFNDKQMYEYNPATDNWSVYSTNVFPGERNEHSVFITLNDKMYKIGGINYMSAEIKELWQFDFTTGLWTRKNDIPFVFQKATSFKLNNDIYILTKKGQLWKCDFANNNYIQLKDLPFTINSFFLYTFTSNDKAFAVFYGHTFEYNPTTDKWAEVNQNPFRVEQYSSDPMGFTYKGNGYVLYRGTDLYRFNTTTNEWTFVSFFPGIYATDSYKTAFVAGNKTYVVVTHSYISGGSPLMYAYFE